MRSLSLWLRVFVINLHAITSSPAANQPADFSTPPLSTFVYDRKMTHTLCNHIEYKIQQSLDEETITLEGVNTFKDALQQKYLPYIRAKITPPDFTFSGTKGAEKNMMGLVKVLWGAGELTTENEVQTFVKDNQKRLVKEKKETRKQSWIKPEAKKKRKERNATLEGQKKQKEYGQKYYKDNKETIDKRQQEYDSNSYIKKIKSEYLQLYNQKPENRKKRQTAYQRKKIEKAQCALQKGDVANLSKDTSVKKTLYNPIISQTSDIPAKVLNGDFMQEYFWQDSFWQDSFWKNIEDSINATNEDGITIEEIFPENRNYSTMPETVSNNHQREGDHLFNDGKKRQKITEEDDHL